MRTVAKSLVLAGAILLTALTGCNRGLPPAPASGLTEDQMVYLAGLLRQAYPDLRARSVTGNSMFPTIPDGSLILTVPIAWPTINEVVVVRVNDRHFVHRVHDMDRILGSGEYFFRTKGDANSAPDHWTLKATDGPFERVVAVIFRHQ